MLMAFAGLAHFNRVAISVAGSEVFIGPDQLTETQMGWVYTTFLIVYTLGMVPGGWLIDRIGSTRALSLLGLAMGTFVALTGTLAWLTHTPSQLWIGLLVIRGLGGLWNAPLHPGAAHVVSHVMPGPRRATANGLVTAGALLGIAACYPVFGALIDHFTWPWAFLISGAALVGYGVVWHVVATRMVPRERNLSGAMGAAASRLASDSLTPPAALAIDWTLLRQLNLWLVGLSYAAYGYFQYLFFYWMSYYFEKVVELPVEDARQASFYVMLAQAAGMALGGWATDSACRWWGMVRGRQAVVMTGMGCGAIFGLVAVSVEASEHVILALAVSMGALGICEGVFWTTATDIGGRSRGLAGAVMNACGNAGGLISPVLTPAMAESLGWPGAIGVACAISAVGGILWFVITPRPADPSSS